MALRAAVLAPLTVWSYGRVGVSLETTLVSYVFVLFAMMLTLDLRHFRVK